MICASPLAMIWRPYYSPVLTLLVVGILIVLAVWANLPVRGSRSVTAAIALLMRCILILMIALLLMGPSTLEPGRESSIKSTLRILLDRSASMQTPDVGDLPRYDYARQHWLSPDRLQSLREDYDVKLFAFDQSLRAIQERWLKQTSDEVATAGVSHIATSVADSLTGTSQSGEIVLVLSDGRDTLDAPMHPVGRIARSVNTPIYTVSLGGPSMTRDLAVTAVPAQPYLFAEEPGSITVRVMRSNIHQFDMVLHVEQDGRHDTYPLDFLQSDTASIDIPIRHDAPGTYDYKVWVDCVPGEADDTNNTQPVFIEVTAKRLRVLVLEGQPYWDTKFLAHALRQDPRIELTQITQLSHDRREIIAPDNTDAIDLPDSLEALAQYDVIILGKKIGNVLDERTIALLPKYVSEQGGRLVFARGRAYDPEAVEDASIASALRVLEPVVFSAGTWHNQRLALEPAGLRHPGLQPTDDTAPDKLFNDMSDNTEMPTLLDVPVIEREKAAARVLARTRPVTGPINASPGQPAIVTMPYGRGMVVAVLGEGLWRWALKPRAQNHNDDRFDRFWMDNVRWLALGSDYQPGETMSLRLSRLSVQVGDPIQIDLVGRSGLDAEHMRVEVKAPDHTITTLALKPVSGSTTRFQAAYMPALPGVHHVRAHLTEHPGRVVESRFNSYHIDVERMHTSANPTALRMLSQASGGRCLDPRDPDAFNDLLTRQRLAAQTPPAPIYLWNRGWVMTLVLCWAGLEWIVRRVGRLP